jgi:hypothetical protein
MTRVSTALFALLVLLACGALVPVTAAPQTFREVVATRPSPKLDDLADRSAPERVGDVASESFWDLLKLRDNPDPAAVPALVKVLASNAGSRRIHEFAATQALFQIGNDATTAALDKHLLRPDYPVDLAVGYTSHWGMADPGRTRFLDRSLVRSVGEGVAVSAEPEWRERDGRRALVVTVTLTNTSAKPLALLSDPEVGTRFFLRGPDGHFVPASVFGIECFIRPRYLRLEAGATDRRELTLEWSRDPKDLDRFGPDRPAAALTRGVYGFGLAERGKYKLCAMVAQPPVPPDRLAAARAAAKDDGPPADLWVGRALSEPAEIDVAVPAAGNR